MRPQDLTRVTRLEVVADTSQEDLSPLGEARPPRTRCNQRRSPTPCACRPQMLPMLGELKLNNSFIPSLRHEPPAWPRSRASAD